VPQGFTSRRSIGEAHDDRHGFNVIPARDPREVRESLPVQPGQKIEVIIVHQGRAEFVPIRGLKAVCGLLRGIDTRVPREKDCV
jgi:hypothetical protein